MQLELDSIFLSPTKLDIKPAKTSPVPITASSFEDLLLRIIFFDLQLMCGFLLKQL